jgi:hypothetical protein
MIKACIIIYHQCSPNLKNDLEASDAFTDICSNQDVIGLLKLVQSLCCSNDTKTQGVMAMVALHKCLFTHYQKDTVDNHTYHQEFLAHIKTIETFGGIGAVGVVPTFLATKIKELADAGTITDADNPTDAKRAIAISAICEEYLAALMLSGTHRECFGDLRMYLKNQYGYGDDRYPKTLDACLSLLNSWTPSTHHKSPRTPKGTNPVIELAKEEDKALVFAQHTKKPFTSSTAGDDSSLSKSSHSTTPKKSTNVRCRLCGKLGHTSAVCPDAKPPAQVHAMSADMDDASVASDDSSVIILTQKTGRSSIPPDYLLIDSQSTTNLFSNPEHINNVHPVAQPINVHCNKGVTTTSTVADFDSNEVYLNKDGIANVLSLFLLSKKQHITYDSHDCRGVFKVHTSGGLVEFKPTSHGLHALDLHDNPNAAHLLVTSTYPDEAHLHVNTVHENHKGFTPKQIKRAHEARRLMLMTGIPSEHAFLSMVSLNQVKDCPIMHDDIKTAHTLFGPDLANIRGKSVRRSSKHVKTNYVEIP